MILNWLGFNFSFVVLVFIAFGILQWLQIPAGSFLDWVIALAIFEWLLVIVTVPWNVHFEAKEVLNEAEISQKKGIPVDAQQVNYAKKIAKGALGVAISLHILSAMGFYTLAITGISSLGYVSSGAALFLTFLRPILRGYQYLAARLAAIRQQIQYPREDVLELQHRFNVLEDKIKRIEEQLDPEEPYSWAATFQRHWQEMRQEMDNLVVSQTDLSRQNQADHKRLERQAQEAIAQFSADGQFLDHVREIIRFFKTA